MGDETLDKNYRRISSSYLQLENLYNDMNIISVERSLIEIETDSKDLVRNNSSYCPIKRYKENVDYLALDKRWCYLKSV
jgi:hypothetical protein